MTISGSCLCGEISYKCNGDIKMIINCHCEDCQAATGSVHGTMLFVSGDDLEINGSPKTFSHSADSGNTLTKHFCGSCGSQLFGTNTMREGVYGIRAGTVHQKDSIKPGMNIYLDSAVPSTPMDPELKTAAKMP